MFLTPYQTSACSSYRVEDIRSALQRAFIREELQPAKTVKGTAFPDVYIVPLQVKDVAPFPFAVDVEVLDKKIVVVDVRGFTKLDRQGATTIVSAANYDSAVLMAAMIKSWIDGGAARLQNIADFPTKVFSYLLAETIVRRLGLGPYDQQAITAACALHYLSCFTGSTEGKRELRERHMVTASRATQVGVNVMQTMFENPEVDFKGDLDSFVSSLKAAVNNPRIQSLNIPLIITMLGGVWFGANAREQVAVALEYPPVWMVLVYQALNDRSFHGSNLTKLVERLDRQQAGQNYSRSFNSNLERLTDV